MEYHTLTSANRRALPAAHRTRMWFWQLFQYCKE